ncbi:SAM-dependent methyltransferase [Pseudonocardia acaciae]|uniref:SAM-dependent methyltransferase n=1 Tax=Pseudonocardia acaciae TaxID=551276 RepID=UPI00048B10E2|nr:SAM-dependent methyltransferase [Pseudonocardia acaciae]
MADSSPDPRINFGVPGAARIWNYWMGGKDYYAVDKQAGDAGLELYDMRAMARECRQASIRIVRFLAGEAGIRQFLDIGAGLPAMQNTHEIAQSIAPECRVVYVDNDPVVLAHARALLTNTTPEGVTAYIEADCHDPDLIVSDARNVLNFNEPIAVMFMGVLGHARSFEAARSIVARVMDAVAPGSYLATNEANDTNEDFTTLCANYEQTGAVPYVPYPVEEIRRRFDGLEMVEPGLVPVTDWRPEVPEIGSPTPMREVHVGVARKP